MVPISVVYFYNSLILCNFNRYPIYFGDLLIQKLRIMIQKSFTIALITAALFTSCKENPKQETTEMTAADTVMTIEEPVETNLTSALVDGDGKKLDVVFNSTNETATITIEGEVIELKRERSGSGYWYKNDHYELRGQGEQAELTKDGVTIFKN